MGATANFPEVDYVADQIDGVGIMMLQEVKDGFSLRCSRSEVNIRNKERAKFCASHLVQQAVRL